MFLQASGWALVAGLFPALLAATEASFEVALLDAPAAVVSVNELAAGAVDDRYTPFDSRSARVRPDAFWLRLRSAASQEVGAGVPTLNVRKGRHMTIEAFAVSGQEAVRLRQATQIPGFRGAHEAVFMLPQPLKAGDLLYVRVEAQGRGFERLQFDASTLEDTLSRAAERAHMLALAVGALFTLSCTALLIWFVLLDRLLLLYATLFSLQALYLAFVSGHAFEWPLLEYLSPFASYTWNVTAALSGAASCLFVREIAELRRFSPRVYATFGWLAWTFVLLAFANVLQEVGLGTLVASIGNLIFVGSAIFVLVTAFMAWRRSNRAAGWFLIAWGLLEAFTIATAIRLLVADPENSQLLLYYGLPLSMAAAAVLIALGVADRLRDQRIALSEAQRRAQMDPLTGVLNRRSLVERLDAACLRARARGLPIALLFIDLDHFKEINDTYGHPAGDACLKAIIDPIQAELRPSDVIGRYGGEEFVVILNSADAAAAQPLAERIRKRIADVRVEGFGQSIRVTCSIGVATSDMLGVWGEHLIARADAAVYSAKRAGRNQVQLAAPLAA
ncbi:MAG TPA: diguanylate cyclase [Steroidobacter sp.]|nr:diguanylate cyclase [Steroidobacter sp.]